MSKHDVTCHITLLGEETEVDVEIDVTSWGSAASWDDPGDPIEFEILSVVSTLTGTDYTKYCETYRDFYNSNENVLVSRTWCYDFVQRRITDAIFGHQGLMRTIPCVTIISPLIIDSLWAQINEKHIGDLLSDAMQGPEDW